MKKILVLCSLFATSCLAFDWGSPQRVASNTYSKAWSDGSSATVTVTQLKIIVATAAYTNGAELVTNTLATVGNLSTNVAVLTNRFNFITSVPLIPSNIYSTMAGQFLMSSSNIYYIGTTSSSNWVKLN